MGLIEKLVGEDFTLIRDGSKFYRTAEHSSFVVNPVTDTFFWNSRNIYGGCLTYLIKIRHMSYNDAVNYLKSIDYDTIEFVTLRENSEPSNIVQDNALVDIFYAAGKRNRGYWYNKRGYTDQTVDNFKLGFTGEWFTIPIYENRVFVNFQIRKESPKLIKHWYKGVGPHSFNFSLLQFTDWVIIAEGPPDAIMLRQHDLPGISQTGGSSYWNREWNSLFLHKKIFIVYDNDTAGRLNAKKIGQIFGKKALIYTFSGFPDKYDITDYFKDGNTKESFINLLEKEGKYEYEL